MKTSSGRSAAMASEDSPPDEGKLLRAVQAGHRQAFEPIVQRYKHRIFAFVSLRLGDRTLAEDVTQDVFLRVYMAACKGLSPNQSDCVGWIFTIARNLVVDSLRHRRRHTAADDHATPYPRSTAPADHSPDAAALRDESNRTVADWLAQLPDEQAECVALRVLVGLTFPQIALVLDVPEGTAKSRCRYGLTRLREIVEKESE